jgi:hypothetical protein
MADVAKEGLGSLRGLVHSEQPDYQRVALALASVGVRSGDRVAVVGPAFRAYYARYSRLHVVAEIPATDEFRNLSAGELKLLVERLQQIGVRAIVADDRKDVPALANWKEVRGSEWMKSSILPVSGPR